MNDTKDIFVGRDPDSQLRTYEVAKVIFNVSDVVTVRRAIEAAAEELDLPSDWAQKFSVFADGITCTLDKVLSHEAMVLLKTSLTKDNGMHRGRVTKIFDRLRRMLWS